MAKFFIDENLHARLAVPLESVFRNHRFRSCEKEMLLGELDVPLIAELGTRGFDAIITLDAAQLRIDEERNGLRSAGLHWIGLRSPTGSGLSVISTLTANIIAGLPKVLDDWRVLPHAYRLNPYALESSFATVELL
ncbi:hypothetical protein E3O06_12030 [Cryobacterium glaciale]|uniref:Uncharacterized protein n=1 Tax=Cryobacterium glaciale TaxID=1259145 RepID=A0A4R8UTG2_9MICO|nr:hypothetical protein [Cryobacterium glaciale]TFB71565.1 hypothetical protein E3O06_12030 [Cryobacterium glaciale]